MIELQNICFEYGSEEQNIAGRGALHNINLHIPDGQIVLLCGESGCGKTTITRLLNGLIPHFYEGNLTGTICIDARLFEKLRNHGKTILVVTHDLEFIEALHANTICLEELQA